MNDEVKGKKLVNESKNDQGEFNANEVLNNKPENVDENSMIANQLVDENHNKKKIVDKKNTQYRYTKMSNFVLCNYLGSMPWCHFEN
nr:hypothetical protein [Mycoplasmopsis bovis]